MSLSQICNVYEFQKQLNEHYSNLLSDPTNIERIPDDPKLLQKIRDMEDAWDSYEIERVSQEPLPDSASEFIDWYNNLQIIHRNDVSYLFDYLAHEANATEIAFYVCLEEEVDGHFDDVIAMSQLGLRGKPKLIIAENYWDEMGRGNLDDMHTQMFSVSADFLKGLVKERGIDLPTQIPYEALKNGNMLMMYGLRRRFIGRLIGAIGILEDTAPYRFAATVEGMKRCNLPDYVIRYHEAHSDVDSDHGAELLQDVILPLIGENKVLMKEITLGMLIRYRIALDYYASIDKWMKTSGS
ncbi:iron-containing redox enzyme family protein [Nostoc sp. C117]|uniref:iron-containing redox enzyme family protein n=1 Tax=Nostoc sp. C117 TaxID=3349875 RepID=UPI00370DC8E2